MTRALEQLNHVAVPLLRGAEFVLDGKRLNIKARSLQVPVLWHYLAVTLDRQRQWFRHRTIDRYVGMGGTDEQTLVSLVLWCRGLPRLPGYVLKWWQTGNGVFLKRLEEIGYDDAKSLTCVLCGKMPEGGLDWWSLGEGHKAVTGPCCMRGACRKGEAG